VKPWGPRRLGWWLAPLPRAALLGGTYVAIALEVNPSTHAWWQFLGLDLGAALLYYVSIQVDKFDARRTLREQIGPWPGRVLAAQSCRICHLSVDIRAQGGIDIDTVIAARMLGVAFYQVHTPACPGAVLPRQVGFRVDYEANRLVTFLDTGVLAPTEWQLDEP